MNAYDIGRSVGKHSVYLALSLFALVARAESPVGSGTPNYSLDSASCFSWTGNTSGASWTKCSPNVIQQPAPPVAVTPPPQIVEKIVYLPVPSTPVLDKAVAPVPVKKKPRKKVAKAPALTCGPGDVPVKK